MQNGPDFDKLIAPFVEIYQNIEHDLLVKIASHFKLYEEIGFKNSMEWYIKKIEELGGLNQEAINIISKYSKIPKSKIINMLKDAGLSTINLDDIDKLNEVRSYKIDKLQLINSQSFNNVIQNSYKELNDIFKLINTNAVEGTKKAYMSVLNQAYTEVSSGAFDYNTSIKKAINKMVNNGITVATYKQKDGSTRNYSVESAVRRDVLTAVVQCTNRLSDNFINELGAEYVEVSQHLGARNTETFDYKDHSWWQGKIYKLEGSTDEYPNFQETCNEGDIQGIGGANCRHIKWAFFPGISVPKAVHVDKEENDKLYEQRQTQRAYERKIKLYKNKIDSFKEIGDVDSVEKYKNKLSNINQEYEDYCDTNNLKRNYAREQIINNKEVTNLEDENLIPEFMRKNNKYDIKEETLNLFPKKIQEELKEAKVIMKTDIKTSSFNPRTKEITFKSSSDKYSLAHEYAHYLEDKYEIYTKDKKFINLWNKKFSKFTKSDYIPKYKIKNGKKTKEISYYVLKDSKDFVSQYQTRLYKDVFCFDFFNKNPKIKYSKEYFSEGVKYYFKDRDLLISKDKELYNYINDFLGGRDERL